MCGTTATDGAPAGAARERKWDPFGFAAPQSDKASVFFVPGESRRVSAAARIGGVSLNVSLYITRMLSAELTRVLDKLAPEPKMYGILASDLFGVNASHLTHSLGCAIMDATGLNRDNATFGALLAIFGLCCTAIIAC